MNKNRNVFSLKMLLMQETNFCYVEKNIRKLGHIISEAIGAAMMWLVFEFGYEMDLVKVWMGRGDMDTSKGASSKEW